MIKFKSNKDNIDFIKVMHISGRTSELLKKLDSQGLNLDVLYHNNEFRNCINEHKYIMDEIRYYLCNRFNCLLRYDNINKIYDIHKIKCLGIDNTYYLYINGDNYLTNDVTFIERYIKNK